VPIYFYGKYNFYHNAMQTHFTNQLMVAVGETKQSQFFSFLQQNSSAIDGKAQTHNPKVLGAWRRELSTPQGRFCEGYRKIPHESRPTSEMSNATMSKHSDDENDDFSLLSNLTSRRTLNLRFSNAFPGNCRWDRTCCYDVYNSRYRRSKFPYFYMLVDCTLRRLLPNVERLA